MAARPLRLRYFAWLRERLGRSEEMLELPDGVRDVAGLFAYLAGRDATQAALFGAETVVRCAVNQEFASPTTPLAPGDEVGFFPPVTGG